MSDSRNSCPVCNGKPRVLVALSHPMMRRFTIELLERDHACWSAEALDGDDVARAAPRRRAELVILDAATFTACRCAGGCGFPCGRMVVVGPERDLDYEAAVMAEGAGGWVARDDVAEQLSSAMRTALGCTHIVCPPATSQRRSARARGARPSSARGPATRADDRDGSGEESL